MTLEVVRRHEKLASESGIELRHMAPISGAGFWSMCPAYGQRQVAVKHELPSFIVMLLLCMMFRAVVISWSSSL